MLAATMSEHLNFIPACVTSPGYIVLGYITTYKDNYQLKSTVNPEIAFLLTVVTNVILTTLTGIIHSVIFMRVEVDALHLTAGRIWWLGREVVEPTSSYNTAVRMV